jgi:hypothetical protein
MGIVLIGTFTQCLLRENYLQLRGKKIPAEKILKGMKIYDIFRGTNNQPQ